MRKVHLVLDRTIASLSLETGKIRLKYAKPVERGLSSLETTQIIALADLSGITIFSEHHSTLTSNLLFKLAENGIPLILSNSRGEALGMLSSLGYTSQTKRRSLQEEILKDLPFRQILSRRIVQAKLENSATYLLSHSKRSYSAQVKEDLHNTAVEIRLIAQKVEEGEGLSLDSLLGLEGEAARFYWGAFIHAHITPVEFTKRQKHNQAKDLTNMALNYAYSLLFTEMAKALAASGLESALGFYHEPHKARASLVCDLVEEWRSWTADRLVFNHLKTLEPDPDSPFLSRSSCSHLRALWREMMGEEILVKEEKVALSLLIQRQAHSLVHAYEKREASVYEPVHFTHW